MIALTIKFIVVGVVLMFAGLYLKHAFQVWRKNFKEQLRNVRMIAAHNMVGRAATPLNSRQAEVKKEPTISPPLVIKHHDSKLTIPAIFQQAIDYTQFESSAYQRKHGKLPKLESSNQVEPSAASDEPIIEETMAVFY